MGSATSKTTGNECHTGASTTANVIHLRIPRDGDQRSELMAITIPK